LLVRGRVGGTGENIIAGKWNGTEREEKVGDMKGIKLRRGR